MNIKIRKFTEKDIPTSVEIVKETLGNENSKKAKADFLEGLNPVIHEYVFLDRIVAEIDKSVVGVAGVYTLDTHPKNYAGICWFGVNKHYQKLGIGTKLMEKMEEIIKKSGKDTFFVWATPEASHFYKKFGFKETKNYIEPKESNILMIKKLN